ncbi:DNA-binding protein [Patescibacteria group bacterium]|nr:MAG: DNA-binding protein [Patescibacteria group bacterium]
MSGYLTTKQLAEILGVSRVTIFNRIKKGEIKAEKIGKTYIIKKNDLPEINGGQLSAGQKKEIDKGVKKVVREYGETLKMLGQE